MIYFHWWIVTNVLFSLKIAQQISKEMHISFVSQLITLRQCLGEVLVCQLITLGLGGKIMECLTRKGGGRDWEGKIVHQNLPIPLASSFF